MGTKVSIHQPPFFGWLGYWDKLAKSDIVILYDTAQYNTKNYQNRCQIRTPHSAQWITVPVKSHQDTLIKDVMIDNTHRWSQKMLRTIKFHYGNAKYFNDYFPRIATVLTEGGDSLYVLNASLIMLLAEMLGFEHSLERASNLGATGQSNEYLIDLIREVGGDEYITGSTDKDYYDPKVFEDSDINVIDQNFKHPEYTQRYVGFVPGCSIIDLLFNRGPDSKEIICLANTQTGKE